ncbi:MAG: transglutaminase domain-containing protein, partial [Clostridiales bacterium]|nr:transglutaminase domain-containing protein [Clostridiales bacterium]
KSFIMDTSIILNDSILYVPIGFITEFLDINVEYDKLNKILRLTNNEYNIYTTYKNYFYKTIEIPKFNINIDIPYYWDLLDEETLLYGKKSNYEDITLNVRVIKNPDDISIDEYINTLHDYTEYVHDEGEIKLTEEKTFTTSGFNGKLITYNYEQIEGQPIYAYYITKVNDLLYILDFNFINKDLPQLLSTIENIINSFEIKSLAIDSTDEHYIEYPKFYNLDTTLQYEIYSNMQAYNNFNFVGTINPLIENIRVTVEKSSKIINFNIPVSDGTFDEEIYLPFGLGKHNVSIFIDTESDIIINPELVDLEIQSNLLMKFSVINISDDFIRYTLPDINILPNHQHILSMAYLITRDSLSDYAKAYDIYKYILENVQVNNEKISQNSYDVYLYNEGNNIAITNCYVSLLRGIGIPSRVYKGTNRNSSHNWAEVYLNNNWYIVDPTFGILTKDHPDNKNYFIVNKEDYYSNYDIIEEVTN